MIARKYLVFILALALWAGVFYSLDRSIMQAQGLPVGADLMPQ